MKEKDDEQFGRIMAAMAAAFPHVEVNEKTVAVYFLFLKDLELSRVHSAVVDIISSSKDHRFPSIADIRKKAVGMEDEDVESNAAIAWNTAKRALSGMRMKEAVTASGNEIRVPPLVEETVNAAFGGWDEFGNTDRQNEVYDRAHFIKCFKAVARTEQKKLLLGERKTRLLKE